MLKVELSRFRVKKGKTAKVDEWLKFLNDNMADTLLTLENEKMYVESIHREVIASEVVMIPEKIRKQISEQDKLFRQKMLNLDVLVV